MTERIEIYILSQLQFHFIFSKGKALAGAISSVFSGRIRVRGALPRSPPVNPSPMAPGSLSTPCQTRRAMLQVYLALLTRAL